MPKVSVIIPVYNTEKYLGKCLDSVLKQSFKDFEVLCINDCSKDYSLKILEEYSKKDKRINIINNEKNLGAALTRNKGIESAKGEYIYFLDADDYIDEDYLEKMVEKIEQENCDIVLNLSIVNEENSNSREYKHPSMPKINPEGEYLDKITTIHDAPCFIWARIYRKSLINNYNIEFPDINIAEDVVFNAITTLFADKTFIFYGPVYHYTITDTSLIGTSKSVDNRDFQHIRAYSMLYDYLKEHNKLDNRLKLFRVYPFMKVDTEDKFITYKNFFGKIYDDFKKNENIYNDLEKYFASSLLSSSDYEEYLKNYNKVVTIGFLRRGKR